MAGTEGSQTEEKSGHIWSLLPGFDPATDDPREYADKIRFLHSICPAKDRPMLAPRLALLMKGTAWAQVKALDGTKLSDPNGGIKLLLQTVADWEDSAELQTYEKFERALYKVTQKQDESVFSYVNRMNVAFAEIDKVTVPEIKAFIMLRQSGLGAEDKKRVLAMCGGELRAKKVEDSMRQLAPRVLVGTTGTEPKKKVYAVNFVDDDEDMPTPAYFADEEQPMDDEHGIQLLMEQGDEDALMITEFEDQLIEACQDNPDLSMCFSAYTEARGRVREKIRSRGFWPPVKGKGKPKGSKKGTWNPKGGFRRRQSLADRIANSHCRLCGARGHWRQECPNKGNAGNANASSAEIHVSTLVGEGPGDEDPEVLERLPISLEQALPEWWPVFNSEGRIPEQMNETMSSTNLGKNASETMDDRQVGSPTVPTEFCWDSKRETRVNEEFNFAALSLRDMKQTLKRGVRDLTLGKCVRSESPPLEPVFFVDHGSVAILDTGASKSVIGKRRLEQLISSLPQEFARKISWQKSETIFRFGNNGTLASLGAVFMPFGKGWLKIEVVDGTTPFLLSNAFLKAVSADICTSKRLLCMFHGKVSVPLNVSSKGLFLVDLLLILKHANQLEMNGNWEVVTNLTDETQQRSRQHPETNTTWTADMPQSHTPPAATRVSSTCEQSPASPKHYGAQEGDHHLCLRRDHGCAPGIPRGCHAGDDSLEQRCNHRQTTRSDDSTTMGRADNGGRKACREDLLRHPGHRCELCRVHEKEERLHFSLGTELPQLRPGSRQDDSARIHGSSSTGVDPTDDQGRVESAGCNCDRLGCDRRIEESTWLGSSARNHILGKWAHDGKEDGNQQRRPQEDAGGHAEGDPRPRESNSDTDCDLAARADILDASRRAMNNPKVKSSYDDEQFLTEVHDSIDTPISNFYAQELSNLVEKIELQLEELAHHSADIRTRHSAPRFTNSKERLDILEIYCFPDSQLTQTAHQLGLKARRFTLQDGDLRTPEGQERLWQIMETQRPRHIWASPDCKLWGNFARRNMGRSKQLRTRILDGRKHERPNLSLCEEIYLYQVENGRHFHLEQPVGSELLLQPELEQTRYGTLPTIFDMCEVGKLNWKGEPLQKRTIVLTTSRIIHGALDCRYCCKTHEHRQIAGQVKHGGSWISLSSFAAKYTAGFARTVVRAMQREFRMKLHCYKKNSEFRLGEKR